MSPDALARVAAEAVATIGRAHAGGATLAEWRALQETFIAIFASYETRLAAAQADLAEVERKVAALRELAASVEAV